MAGRDKFVRVGPYRLESVILGYGKPQYPCMKYFLATNTKSGATVVMKTVNLLSPDGPVAEEKLKQEQHILRVLSCRAEGIIKQYGLHYISRPGGELESPGKVPVGVGLALSQYTPQDCDPCSISWTTMSAYLLSHEGGRIEQRRAFKFYLAIASRVSLIHEAGVAMLDLKLSDVMYNTASDMLVLANFSEAKVLPASGEVTPSVPLGASLYKPPEAQAGQPYSGRKSDIWSLGVMLYEMILGRYPIVGDADAPGFFGGVPLDNGWMLYSETPIHPDLQNVISTLSSRSPENRVIMSVSDIDDQDFLLSERYPDERTGGYSNGSDSDDDIDEEHALPFRQPSAALLEEAGL